MQKKSIIARPAAVVQRRAGNATTALAEYHQLAADLDAFRSCVDRLYMQYDPDTVTCIPPASTAEIKEQVAKLPALRQRWEVACQASTDDEIAKNIGMLVAAFPNQKGADLDYFTQIALTEVAGRKPSRYELIRACSRVQCNAEFLSLAALIKAIRQARNDAAWLARELKSPRLYERLQPNQPAGEEPGAKVMAMVAAAKQRHDDEAERRAKQKVAAEAAQEDEDYEPEDDDYEPEDQDQYEPDDE